MRPVVVVTLVLYLLATAAGVLAILVLTQDFETAGAGLLVPLFVLPAIAFYAIAPALQVSSRVCHAGYWALALPFPAWLLYVAFFASPAAASDGAHQLAMAVAVPMLAAAVVS